MSEPTPARPKKIQISNMDFFRVCNLLINKREVVQKECHQYRDVVRFVSDELALTISKNTVANALEATGIVLEKKAKEGRKVTAPKSSHNSSRILAQCLKELYAELGLAVPARLTTLLARLNGDPVEAAAPIPVKAVTPTERIAVANNGVPR